MLDIIDKFLQERRKEEFTAKDLCKDSSRASVVFPLLGLILQLAGIIVIGIFDFKQILNNVDVKAKK